MDESFNVGLGEKPKLSTVINELQNILNKIGDVPVTCTYDGYEQSIDFSYSGDRKELSIFYS